LARIVRVRNRNGVEGTDCEKCREAEGKQLSSDQGLRRLRRKWELDIFRKLTPPQQSIPHTLPAS
jgi:hypothetical protein